MRLLFSGGSARRRKTAFFCQRTKRSPPARSQPSDGSNRCCPGKRNAKIVGSSPNEFSRSRAAGPRIPDQGWTLRAHASASPPLADQALLRYAGVNTGVD